MTEVGVDQAAKRRAIEAVYSAVNSDSDWQITLNEICRLAKVPAASLSFIDRTNRPGDAHFTPQRPDIGAIASYVDELAWHDNAIDDDATQLTSTLINRYTHPPQSQRYSVVWSITLRPTAYLECKLALRAHSTDVTPDAVGILAVKQIADHIARAVRIGHSLRSLTAMHLAMHEILDGLPMGLILFGRSGRLLHVNTAAFALNAQKDGIVFTRGGLKLMRRRDQKQLDELIEIAIHEPARQPINPS